MLIIKNSRPVNLVLNSPRNNVEKLNHFLSFVTKIEK